MSKYITRQNMKRVGILWGLLGFHRGMSNYDYSYSNYNNEIENSIRKKKYEVTYLYSSRIAYGIFGTLLYCNPFTVPFMICKEIYIAEVNIRGLELKNEIEKDKYYCLIP